MSVSIELISTFNDAISGSVAVAAFGALAAGVMAAFSSDRERKIRLARNLELENLLKELRAQSANNNIDKEIFGNVPSGQDLDDLITAAVEKRVKSVANELRIKADLVSGLVNSYHTQALSQAKVQFWFSVIAATVGFGYILASALSAESSSEAVIRIIPGAVIDAVAFLFLNSQKKLGNVQLPYMTGCVKIAKLKRRTNFSRL